MERKQRILIKLIDTAGYVPSSQLSKDFSVSTKTIFNDIDKLTPYLTKYHLKIERKPGQGLKIVGSKKNLGNLKSKLDQNLIFLDQSVLTSRQIDICLYIFNHNAYIKDVAANFYISRSTVSRDINQINKRFLSDYHVKIKNQYENLIITGDELSKRKVLSRLIFLKADTGLEHELLKNEVSLYLNRLFNIDLNPLLDFINQIEDDYGINFTIDAEENLLVHLAISVRRIQSQKELTSKTDIKKRMTSYMAWLPVLNNDIKPIEIKYHIHFNENELYLILLYIFSSKRLNQNNIQLSKRSVSATKKFIARISKVTSYNFDKDKELLRLLTKHLEVVSLRIDFGLKIYNPFLNYILENELYLFVAVKDNINLIFHKKVPDSEIAFIAIHFMASEERMKKKKKVLIVCGSGVGVSTLLEERIKNHFSQYEIVGTSSLADLHKYHNIDLIISTVDLKGITSTNYIVIRPFENIKNINELVYQKENEKSISRVHFSRNHCWLLKNINTKEEALKTVSGILSARGFVSKDYFDALMRREQIGSTYIQNKVALVHGVYNSKRLNASLNIFKLDKSVKWTSNHQVDLLINFVLTRGYADDFKNVFQRIGESIDDIKFWKKIERVPINKLPFYLNERFNLTHD